MAVQPDKRSWDRQMEERGANLTERRRVGIYTLQAEARVERPHSFHIRSDRPGLPGWYSVSWYPHDGWVAYDPRNSDDRFCTRGDPVECLRWWVDRRSS
ncbi:hypothetical protein [Frigoribacterium sp. PhB160]|uniref:hypothetical protein n=1 Tax=Frigoribacterium sp. PhB160 TaxID=2485192 RepID=UPI0011CE85EE|nr:hypothetical protein [Frigoribacterium sp. PhB160]